MDLMKYLYEEEKRIIQETLKLCYNNKALAARELGISRTHLYNRLKEYTKNIDHSHNE